MISVHGSDLIVFTVSFLCCYGVLFRPRLNQHQVFLKRLYDVSHRYHHPYENEEEAAPPFLRKILESLVMAFRNLSSVEIHRIKTLLASAGFMSKDGMALYLFAKIISIGFLCCGGGISIFGFNLFQNDLVSQGCTLLFFCVTGFKMVDFLLHKIAKNRREIMERGVSDMLAMMVICTDAGLGLDTTIERVSRELLPINKPLAQELGLTSLELTLMPDRRQALLNFAHRTQIRAISTLATAFLQSEKYGSALGTTLRDLAQELRQERMMTAEAKAARLPATLTIPLILFILPCLFIVILGPVAINI